MSVRETIERWRTDFRQGVADVRPWGAAAALNAARTQAEWSYVPSPQPQAAPRSDPWHDVPEPQEAAHDPLFEHLVTLCEEQEARIACIACHNVMALKKRGVIDRNTVIANTNEAESEAPAPPAGVSIH